MMAAVRDRLLRDEGPALELLVSLGRRTTIERIAHLFCDLHARMLAVGLARPVGSDIPLTQLEIADTLGLSAVHVNRHMKVLRHDDVASFGRGTLTIFDQTALDRLAGFDPSYLLGVTDPTRSHQCIPPVA